MMITQSLIQELESQATEIKKLCAELNSDPEFIKKINGLVIGPERKLLVKTEHFLISDLISLSRKFEKGTNPKSKFILAYYYDVLRNDIFANPQQAKALSELIVSPNFAAHFQKITADNFLPLTVDEPKSSVVTVLSDNKNSRLSQVILFLKKFLSDAYGIIGKEADAFFYAEEKKPENNDTLAKTLEELNSLIGLEEIKKDVNELINFLKIQKKRSEEGLRNTEITLHTVFLGPPGTGKTTVARLLSRIFKHLGFLTKGQLVETDREGMVAGYVGQTALKVDAIVKESLGGVLFIDEAYSLNSNGLGNDYGGEAVNTLLKRMEDHREDLAVVVAGYNEPMKLFVESNPGLRSRFSRYFQFDHFTASELVLIFENLAKKSDFILTPDAKEKLGDTFELLLEKKDEGFGNARVVRNLFERCLQNQANRIVGSKKLSKKTLKTLTEDDIPEPNETLEQNFFTTG